MRHEKVTLKALDEKGKPVAWSNRFAGSSVLARWAPPTFNNGLDPDTTEGAIDLAYALPNMHVMSVKAFELTLNLQPIREGRSWAEYCWTVASSLMGYLMPWLGPEGVTYLDSDLMFFSNPKAIFDEIGQRSLGITPHRFSPTEQARLGKNGEFNVGVVVARNTDIGRSCIARWASQCRARCSTSQGCGDQKYLDEWPSFYGEECCVIQNLGVNLGPWSLDHFAVIEGFDGASPIVWEQLGLTSHSDNLNSFHFHELVDHKYLSGYPLSDAVLRLVYCPYLSALEAAKDVIQSTEKKFDERRIELEKQWERV